MPRKRPRKRITAAPRPRPQAPSGPNQVWCYDFVFDHCANGQQLKCLTVADEFTKEGLAIDVDGRIRSGRVIEVLSRLVSARGAPRFLRSDNGPEFSYPKSGVKIGQEWDSFNERATAASCVEVAEARLETSSYRVSCRTSTKYLQFNHTDHHLRECGLQRIRSRGVRKCVRYFVL